jgi:hypothetical protein
MRIAIHSHRRAQEVFMGQESYPVFAGMLVGAAQSNEDIPAVAAHWRRFLKQFGWRERTTPAHRNRLVAGKFLLRERACVSLSLEHRDQVRHVLPALQRLFARREIDVGVLCVSGDEARERTKAELARMRKTVTLPVFVVAVGDNGSCRRKLL